MPIDDLRSVKEEEVLERLRYQKQTPHSRLKQKKAVSRGMGQATKRERNGGLNHEHVGSGDSGEQFRGEGRSRSLISDQCKRKKGFGSPAVLTRGTNRRKVRKV